MTDRATIATNDAGSSPAPREAHQRADEPVIMRAAAPSSPATNA